MSPNTTSKHFLNTSWVSASTTSLGRDNMGSGMDLKKMICCHSDIVRNISPAVTAWASNFPVQNTTYTIPWVYNILIQPWLNKATGEESESLLFLSCSFKGHRCLLLLPGTSKPLLAKSLTTPKRSFAPRVFQLYWKKILKEQCQSLICIRINSGNKKSLASPGPSYGHLEWVLTNLTRFLAQTL